MPESRQVTLYQPVTPATWDLITRLAPSFYQSRLFSVASPEQAAMVMLKGHELCLGLAASFEFIHIVEGKPSLSPHGALALVQRSELLAEMEVIDGPEQCTVRMVRKGGPAYQVTYTLKQAERAGIIKPRGAWEKWPENMLRWRAIGFVIDVLFSDVTGGLKRADEFGAEVDEAGDVVIEQKSDVIHLSDETLKHAETVKIVDTKSHLPTTELYDLVEKFGPELIFEINGGKIPTTNEEIRFVAERLEQLEEMKK